MFPDAKIECSEHISNLIEAFLRRNMVKTELKEEVALQRMLEKKPRPFEMIQGLAFIRPKRTEYKPGYRKNLKKLKNANRSSLALVSDSEEIVIPAKSTSKSLEPQPRCLHNHVINVKEKFIPTYEDEDGEGEENIEMEEEEDIVLGDQDDENDEHGESQLIEIEVDENNESHIRMRLMMDAV